ncbi:MAG: uroporphyrinogen-III synthase [Xanthomonadales bacterium]|nr:uroporphyrinogen-III synthase [Xanthomonadales bacterium]
MTATELESECLRGRSLVLTRPAGENRAFAAELRRRGAEVVTLAPFRVVARKDPAIARIALRAAANADVLVFASTLAVRHAFALVPDFVARGAVIAQGPATRDALAAHGVHAEMPATGFRSEEVLQHPWLARAPGGAHHRRGRTRLAGAASARTRRRCRRSAGVCAHPLCRPSRDLAPHRRDGAAATGRQQSRGAAGAARPARRYALVASGRADPVRQQRPPGGAGAWHALSRRGGRGLGAHARPERRHRGRALIAWPRLSKSLP